jgi:hypothetical protein
VADGDRGLEILGQSTIAVEPSKTPLNNPSSRMNGEADLIGGLADDLDGDTSRVGDALGSIGGISEGTLDERKAATRGLQQRHSTVAILNRGGMDLQHQWPPISVHHGVPLAAITFLPAS